MLSNIRTIPGIVGLSLVCTVLAASPSQARNPTVTVVAKQDVSDLPQVRVAYDDLNLASERGAKSLDHRVSVAVNSVCNVDYSERNLGQSMAASHCSDVAWNGARPQVRAAIERARGEAANHVRSSLPAVAIMIAAPIGQ